MIIGYLDPWGKVTGLIIRVPLRGSFKGSIGGLGFRVCDINPALPITRNIPEFP